MKACKTSTHATASRSLLSLLLSCCVLVSCDSQSHYYTLNRGSGSRGRMLSDGDGGGGGMLDTLQRGHEGILVHLDSLSQAIKEDELKLNNVFYKLGRHDTDIQTTTSVQISLKDTTRKLETKLNKQAYNLDFLRRHVSDLKRGVSTSAGTAAEVSTLQATVRDLQMSLAQALYRTEQLENKTKSLEDAQHLPTSAVYSPPIDENNFYYASKLPRTTYYYLDSDSMETVCDEASGWVYIPGGGCWLVGGDEEVMSYVEAVARCAKVGAVLAQPPHSDGRWPHLISQRMRDHKNQTSHWSSGTSAFTPDQWTYLFSGEAVPAEHWISDQQGVLAASSTKRCAAMTSAGLLAADCASRYSYVCKKL